MSFFKILFLMIASGVAGFAGWMLFYLGAFKPVQISESTRGPFVLVYKNHLGPYHKIVSSIEEVENFAKAQGLDCNLTFGEYLDNPKTGEEDRLRSRGGCLFDPSSSQAQTHAEFITSTETSVKKIPWPKDFIVETRPANNYVQAQFDGSPGIGPMKVYPKVADYFREHHLEQKPAVIEIYQIHSREEKNAMTTTYLFAK
ncbi:MAG: GyrI-like domain-containing protein [Pseudobdellovibrionaceae bacterium]